LHRKAERDFVVAGWVDYWRTQHLTGTVYFVDSVVASCHQTIIRRFSLQFVNALRK
jgi:hypothetical protein